MGRDPEAPGTPVVGGAASSGGRPALPVLHTVEEVADALRTSREVIYEMVRKGQIPGVVRLGRRLLFRRERLLEFLRKNTVASLGGEE